MIQKFIDEFMSKREELKAKYKLAHPIEYGVIVKDVIKSFLILILIQNVSILLMTEIVKEHFCSLSPPRVISQVNTGPSKSLMGRVLSVTLCEVYEDMITIQSQQTNK